MNQEELYEEVKGGGLSPADLQRLRDDIREHTDKYVPRRRTEMVEWYENNKSTLTRALKPEEADDGDEEDLEVEETDTESEDNE